MAVAQANRTTCPVGHPYDCTSGGRRRCMACKRDRYHARRPPKATDAEFVWARIARADDGCWHWIGGRASNGYGTMRGQLAHRVVYELLVEPIPEALCLDHLCRVRHCVNPSHLEPVTLAENVRRGAAARREGR